MKNHSHQAVSGNDVEVFHTILQLVLSTILYLLIHLHETVYHITDLSIICIKEPVDGGTSLKMCTLLEINGKLYKRFVAVYLKVVQSSEENDKVNSASLDK